MRQYVSVVYAIQSVVICYDSPRKLIQAGRPFPTSNCFSMTLGPQFGFDDEVTHGVHLLPAYIKNDKISCGLAFENKCI